MSRHVLYLHTIALVPILLISACAQTPRQKVPLQLQQAQRHNLAGIAADEKDSLVVAEAELMESYRLFASVENYCGMATALINSSRVYRRQGDVKKTDNVLKQAGILISNCPELETELCFESCKLALLKGDKDGALLWAEKGVTSAKDADRGRMLNLLAGVHLHKDSTLKGREIAGSALNSAKSSSDRREEANALRTLGEIAYLEKLYKDAFQLYDSALAIDKELAIPMRVSADLAALSLAAEALGDISRSAEYLQRSIDATIADQSIKMTVENLDRLINLYQRSGNNDSAEKVLKLKNSLQRIKAD